MLYGNKAPSFVLGFITWFSGKKKKKVQNKISLSFPCAFCVAGKRGPKVPSAGDGISVD